jgi:hypothetical protein
MEVLHQHCAGLDVHKDSVVARVRHIVDGDLKREVRSFKTTTKGLMASSEWLSVECGTHIVMEVAGVYWKPGWLILGTASSNWCWRMRRTSETCPAARPRQRCHSGLRRGRLWAKPAAT